MTDNAKPVARVASWTNGSYSRNYKLEWLRDVPEGTLLYAVQPPQDERGQPVALSTLTDADYNEAMARVLASEKRGSPAVQLSVALLRRIIAAASAPALQAAEGKCKSCDGTGVDGDCGDDGRTIDVDCGACKGTGKADWNPPTWRDRWVQAGQEKPALQAGQGEHRVFRDGNQWCAVGPEFKNLQESPAGFGDTPAAALDALALDTPGNRNPESRYAGYKGEPLPDNATEDQAAAWGEGKRATSPTHERAAPASEPVHVEAVAAVVHDYADDGVKLDWLVEGGICSLPEGVTLYIADRPITDDNGSGEVYLAPSQPVAAEGVRDAQDAARYRWLRHGDNDEVVLCCNPFAEDDEPSMFLPRGKELDDAIDAALSGSKGGDA